MFGFVHQSTRCNRLLLILPIALLLLAGSLARADQARERFQAGWEAAERGDFDVARTAWLQLEGYPLAPYLEARLLQADQATAGDRAIERFLMEHGTSVVTIDLRRQWLTKMAHDGAWEDYLAHYHPRFATLEQECWRLHALLKTEATAQLLAEVGELWTRPYSLPAACDPAFAYWLASDADTQPRVWQRLLLAIEHNNVRLARYLIDLLEEEDKAQGQRLLQIHREPSRMALLADDIRQGPHAEQILRHGFLQWARLDRLEADRYWLHLTHRNQLTGRTAFETRRAIARQMIAADGIAALPWLLERDADAEDSYLLEWRIRLALQQADWSKVEHWIAQLPADLAAEPRWRYWQARAWLADSRTGTRRIQAMEALATLARERNFYGFLAADLLAVDYQFDHQSLVTAIDPGAIEHHPAIARAQEWLALGETRRARREWRAALSSMTSEEQRAATLLAHQWQWHEQAIHTALRSGIRDDLQVRFPLAHLETIGHHTQSSEVPPPWVLAVARQESSFSADAISPAGARGLLQLMPSTAQELAARMGKTYRLQKLHDAEYSIQLGSRYLAELLDLFNGSRVLATAAYNAGPHRIERVLAQQQQSLPVDIWIETLPYFETRSYVQSVLSFALIYQHRLGQQGRLLAQHESEITPLPTLLAQHKQQERQTAP